MGTGHLKLRAGELSRQASKPDTWKKAAGGASKKIVTSGAKSPNHNKREIGTAEAVPCQSKTV
jgi:hypothetical protein